MQIRIIALAWVLGISLLFPAAASSGGTDAIKSRMIARLPAIEKFKAEGVVGENNRGYLAVLKENPAAADLVAAENQDRRTIYAAIARQQGTTLEVVETHRAAQIEQKADPGEWLQDATGKWYQKAGG